MNALYLTQYPWQLLRALGKANAGEIDLLIRHESRAAEVGRALTPKRLSVAARQAWGAELATFTQR